MDTPVAAVAGIIEEMREYARNGFYPRDVAQWADRLEAALRRIKESSRRG